MFGVLNGPGARIAMATILAFSNLNGKKTNNKSSRTNVKSDHKSKKAEIVIFPGVRIERISSDKCETKQNIDKLSKVKCHF
ncbi:hypothetical protein NBRC116602_27600 [Hyphomicrobiales bacterium 4NK60-0047b]